MQIQISIIIPLYNAEKYISETLDSVLKQTYENWECIIVDDGSTDNSAHIVQIYCIKDSRFRYFHQKNKGPSCARNMGFKLSHGGYIQFLDADDVIPPQRLMVLIDEYDKTEQGVILYSDLLVGHCDNIYQTTTFPTRTTINQDIDFRSMYKHFFNEIMFIPGCILFPRESLLEVEWDESLKYSEDWDLYLQITVKNSFRFRNVPIMLIYYRNTANSLSSNLENVYTSCYYILNKFRNYHFHIFVKKVGHFFCRNLMAYRKNRIKSIVIPWSIRNPKSLVLIAVFPVSFIYCIYYCLHTKR